MGPIQLELFPGRKYGLCYVTTNDSEMKNEWKITFSPSLHALIGYRGTAVPLFTAKESAFSISVPKSGHALEHNSEFQNYTHYEVNYVQARRNFSLGFSNEEGRPGVAKG